MSIVSRKTADKKRPLVSFVGDKDDDRRFTVFNQIRETLGDDEALELASICGGERLRLPSLSSLKPHHPLAVRIGFDLAHRICEAVAPFKGTTGYFYVPRLDRLRIRRLLEEDGVSVREISQRTGVCMRTVHREKARMLNSGFAVGHPKQPRKLDQLPEWTKGERIVRRLLLQGHSPSQIRDILKVPGTVVLTIRAELLKQGKI